MLGWHDIKAIVYYIQRKDSHNAYKANDYITGLTIGGLLLIYSLLKLFCELDLLDTEVSLIFSTELFFSMTKLKEILFKLAIYVSFVDLEEQATCPGGKAEVCIQW